MDCAVFTGIVMTQPQRDIQRIAAIIGDIADRYRQDLDRTGLFFTNLTNAILARDAGESEALVAEFGAHQKALIQQALASSA